MIMMQAFRRLMVFFLAMGFSICEGFPQINDLVKDTGTFLDVRDNQTYRWVQIGGQVWMAQNLNYKVPKSSWCYLNDSIFCLEYGRLYNWSSANSVCPQGWHLPSNEEWTKLTNVLGSQAGDMLKENDTLHWLPPNDGATVGYAFFNARAAGSRCDLDLGTKSYADIKKFAMYWSSTKKSSQKAQSRFLYYRYDNLSIKENSIYYGFSVRCIKNLP